MTRLFRRRPAPVTIHPTDWPDRSDRPRVLIENPDFAELWAHREVLEESGYEVAVCGGPVAAGVEGQHESVCPLVANGRCALVQGADVVVTTTRLEDSGRIFAAAEATGVPMVVEGCRTEPVDLPDPVTPTQLRDAVAQALPPRT